MRLAVIIPAREAANELADCLAAIDAQDLPPEEMWIVVAPSRDDTDAVAKRLADGREDVRVIDNPAGDRGSALNLAIGRATADVLAFVDAQARLAPDYLAAASRSLAASDAAVVGGPMRPEGRTTVGRALALALASPFGIGDSQFHFEGSARLVESVYLGVYRSAIFSAVGGYNPALRRTEDDDLNWRVRAAGMRIWMDPAIRSTYLCRNDLVAIWRQFYGYGFWKVALATLRPGAIRPRHLVPMVFVIGLTVAAAVSVVAWWPALPAVLAAYLVAAIPFAVAGGGSWSSRLLFPVVTCVMHVAYGVGSLGGILSWSRLRRMVRRGVST
jgi:glycosyltransferase involved in cell wall biosynthesis